MEKLFHRPCKFLTYLLCISGVHMSLRAASGHDWAMNEKMGNITSCEGHCVSTESPSTRLFVQQLVQASNKGNLKAQHYKQFVEEWGIQSVPPFIKCMQEREISRMRYIQNDWGIVLNTTHSRYIALLHERTQMTLVPSQEVWFVSYRVLSSIVLYWSAI